MAHGRSAGDEGARATCKRGRWPELNVLAPKLASEESKGETKKKSAPQTIRLPRQLEGEDLSMKTGGFGERCRKKKTLYTDFEFNGGGLFDGGDGFQVRLLALGDRVRSRVHP
ncbi:hypothetical protein BHM03_00014995 [Ensete ventricosum]|uniref:Uncharacterized protein n=1 Tax=Ensete ventricosum TaxID=4639 RepID=A0A445MEC0_ENSVE|nr:hypothetical protein BHM03_00014995 [Ensete ventricosum]